MKAFYLTFYKNIRWIFLHFSFFRKVLNKRGHKKWKHHLSRCNLCVLLPWILGRRRARSGHWVQGLTRGKPGGSIRVILQLPAYGESTDERKKAYMAEEKRREKQINLSLTSCSHHISQSVSFRRVFQPLRSIDMVSSNSRQVIVCGKPHRESGLMEGEITEWHKYKQLKVEKKNNSAVFVLW